MSALSRCIAIPAERFADEHWGRLPLLTSRGELAAGFDDLLDASAVDELVSRRGLRTPFLRMAKDGDLVAPKRYTRGGGAGAGAPDQARLMRTTRHRRARGSGPTTTCTTCSYCRSPNANNGTYTNRC